MELTRTVTAAAIALELAGMGAFANPETLILRNVRGDKTIEVEFNYDKYPKTDPPPGWQWSDFDRDTLFYDSSTMGTGPVARVQYNHLFRARFGGSEGLGYDYIDYEAPGRGNEHYHGMFGFVFQDDTLYQSMTVDGAHYRENAKLPVPNAIFAPGSTYQLEYFSARLPGWTWLGADSFLLIDRIANWGNGQGGSDPGADITQGRNGKAGALAPWNLLRMIPKR